MKKSISTLIILVVASITSYGQNKFKAGIKAGFGFATLTNIEEGTKGTTAYLIGIQSDYKINEIISLGAEAYYNRHGSENHDNSSFLYFNYVNVPLLVRYFPVGGLNLHAGPEFSFMTSSDVNSMNASEVFNKFNLSVGGGVGYRFKFGLTADLRHNVGLTDVSSLFISKTNYSSLSIGYLF